MKKKSLFLGLVLTALVLAGCGKSSDEYASSSSYANNSYSNQKSYSATEAAYADSYDSLKEETIDDSGNVTPAEAEQVTESATTNRKLIRTLNLDIETYDFDSCISLIPNKVAALGGYIEESSVDGNKNSYYRYASYTIRVPEASADDFVATLDGQSNIVHQSESVEDITLNYVDTQSRKESLQVEYDRLQEMLGQAETVEDMIKIEERLSSVRYEIQSVESQLRTYDNKIDYTTIYLYVSEVKEYTEPEPRDESLWGRIKYGLSEAGDNIVEFLKNFVVFIIVAIPYIIVYGIAIGLPIFLIVKLIRKLCKRSSVRAEEKAAKKQAKIDKKQAKIDNKQTELTNKQEQTKAPEEDKAEQE